MKQMTIAQVGQNFTVAAREAEQEPIEITRHGHGVLVLLSSDEFKRLSRPFPARLRAWLAENTPTPGHAFEEHR
ncbi:type II toxin-antitoxin system Phd/YefM family antitoxin [Pendulispora brunnea]|uniref:Type II toxin-antitoxin system Phd/YefM family antitoxin n=1 Tax=Pendulispora brunnea TaxID=2905690 RepID=A0ABZ2KFR9_9BACT